MKKSHNYVCYYRTTYKFDPDGEPTIHRVIWSKEYNQYVDQTLSGPFYDCRADECISKRITKREAFMELL